MRNKRNLKVIIACTLVLVAALIGWWRYDVYQNGWGKINFQTYAPSYIPDNGRLTAVSIDANYLPADNPTHTTVLHLALNGGSFIYEQNSKESQMLACPMGKDCTSGRTAQNHTYQMSQAKTANQQTEQIVQWTEDGTVIQAHLVTAKDAKTFSNQVIEQFIDGFHAKTYSNLLVNHNDYSHI